MHKCKWDMLRLYHDAGFEQDGPTIRRIYVYECPECGHRYRVEEVFEFKYTEHFSIENYE